MNKQKHVKDIQIKYKWNKATTQYFAKEITQLISYVNLISFQDKLYQPFEYMFSFSESHTLVIINNIHILT